MRRSLLVATLLFSFSQYAIMQDTSHSNIDEDKLQKIKYKFKSIVSCIGQFPSEIPQDYTENYSIEDTRLILKLSEDEQYNLESHISDYHETLEKINTSDFEDKAYTEIDGIVTHYNYGPNDWDLKQLNDLANASEFALKNMYEDNATLSNLNKYVNKILDKIQSKKSEALSKVVVSDLHAQSVSQILFTNNLSLDPESATAADFKTNFTAGENIKAIAYLADTYLNIFGESNDPQFEVISNNGPMDMAVENYKKGDEQKPYVVFYFNSTADAYTPKPNINPGTLRAMEYLANLNPRTHSLEVKLDSYMGRPKMNGKEGNVTGKIRFDASDENGIEKIKGEIAKIKDKALQSVELPKAGMRNSTYEANLVQVFNGMGHSEIYHRAIIGSTDWEYETNNRRRVIGRTLQVYMLSKTTDGGCKYQDFSVIQEKIGEGQWAKNFKRLSTGGYNEFSCSKL